MSASHKSARHDRIPVSRALSVQHLDINAADFDPAVELLTPREAAKLLKISVAGIRRIQQQRLISYFKVRGSIRFARTDLIAYLESCRVKPADQ